ncbi:MAG: hypothetical protein ACK41P_11385 [Asticcacaulis sp.]
MKFHPDDVRSLIASGQAVSHAAVEIRMPGRDIRYWGGAGELELEGATYLGIGDRGLVIASGGMLGEAEGPVTLQLSGVDPALMTADDMAGLRRAPCRVWRLLFNQQSGALVVGYVFASGRLERPKMALKGGEELFEVLLESAGRGSSRATGRRLAAYDQARLTPQDKTLEEIAVSGVKKLYWGGKMPVTAAQMSGGMAGADLVRAVSARLD